MAAAGKVCTGFSLPYVAKYACANGVISYSSGQKLARGVDVSIEPDSSEDNVFYADNVAAETDAGTFTGGTLNLTVDGLFQAAEQMIMGLPAAGNDDDFLTYDDDQVVPYVGVGYIARYQSEGVTTFCPTIIVKAQFNQLRQLSSKHSSISFSLRMQRLRSRKTIRHRPFLRLSFAVTMLSTAGSGSLKRTMTLRPKRKQLSRKSSEFHKGAEHVRD